MQPHGHTPAVVDALVGNHQRFLAFLERRVGDRALAEDILQDAFVRSIDKVDGLRDPGAAVAWFYRLLRNAVVDHQRRSGTASRALSAFASELEAADVGEEAHRDVCRCVSDLAQALKPEYAAALQRIEVEGVPVKDYASEAGITSNNAAVRVFRARAALRERVHATCGACAGRGCVECTCGTVE
jgi:RNA polymerase sigma-70 factor (ECF subfamily)